MQHLLKKLPLITRRRKDKKDFHNFSLFSLPRPVKKAFLVLGYGHYIACDLPPRSPDGAGFLRSP